MATRIGSTPPPPSVPQLVLQSVPQPPSVPQFAPQSVPQLPTQSVPQFAPQRVVQLPAQLVPQLAPQSVPQLTPHTSMRHHWASLTCRICISNLSSNSSIDRLPSTSSFRGWISKGRSSSSLIFFKG